MILSSINKGRCSRHPYGRKNRGIVNIINKEVNYAVIKVCCD